MDDGGLPLRGVRVLALEQMQALPYATMCISCQRELEDEGARYSAESGRVSS